MKRLASKTAYGRLVAAALAAAMLFSACTARAAPVGDGPEATQPPQKLEAAPALAPAAAAPVNQLTGLPRADGLAEDTRPVAIMVDNSPQAWPQRGVAQADVVIEALCEDGQSHFMLLFANPAAVPEVGPIYSARDQFLQLVLPVNAIPVYIGTTVYASNLLNTLAWQDLDGTYIGTAAFSFDSARNLNYPEGKGNEYCWFTNAALIAAGIEQTALNPSGALAPLFAFAETEQTPAQAAQTVNIKFWSNSSAQLVYDAALARYIKHTGIGEGQQTDEDGSRLEFENVLVLQSVVTKKPDGYIQEYDLSQGTGWYFTRGGVVAITWEKGRPTDALQLYDESGQPLLLNTGKTYIALLPTEGEAEVSYE